MIGNCKAVKILRTSVVYPARIYGNLLVKKFLNKLKIINATDTG